MGLQRAAASVAVDIILLESVSSFILPLGGRENANSTSVLRLGFIVCLGAGLRRPGCSAAYRQWLDCAADGFAFRHRLLRRHEPGSARLAEIYLFRISDKEFGSQSHGQTDLEGRFSLHRVEEGDYYVVAVLPGYVNLLSSLTKAHLDAMTDEDRKNLLTQIPKVDITADQPAQVSVRLERGAELDGTVTYDDGSPAIGLRVSYMLKSPDVRGGTGEFARVMMAQSFIQNGQPITDDRGHFRILGVPPGEYLVHATVPTRSSEQEENNSSAAMLGGPYRPSELDVYAGGSLRASKAQAIEVNAGGAARDADIVVPLSRLHTLRGQVLLKSSGQPPVSANVHLLYADTHEEARSVFAPNGQFEFFYVPEDSFILRAAAGAQAAPDFEQFNAGTGPRHIVWTLPQAGEGSPELPLQVTGNVENLSITVPDPDAKKKGPTMEMNRGGSFTSVDSGSDSSDESSDDPH